MRGQQLSEQSNYNQILFFTNSASTVLEKEGNDAKVNSPELVWPKAGSPALFISVYSINIQ